MLVLTLLAVAALNCPILDSEYRLQSQRPVSAAFSTEKVSDGPGLKLILTITDVKTGKSYSVDVVNEGSGAGPDTYVENVRSASDDNPVKPFAFEKQESA